jgi:phage gp36-like protein
MANFLTAGELKTHLYEEVVNEITRNDDSIIDDAIDTAIDEIKGYLHKYDVAACMDTVPPLERHRKLLSVCKDIAAWQLINLCNVTVGYDVRRNLYEDAIQWLQGVQKGQITPDLPVAVIPNASTPVAPIKWHSNAKRNNHF